MSFKFVSLAEKLRKAKYPELYEDDEEDEEEAAEGHARGPRRPRDARRRAGHLERDDAHRLVGYQLWLLPGPAVHPRQSPVGTGRTADR